MNLSAFRKLTGYIDHVAGKVAVKVLFLVLVSVTYFVQAIASAKAVSIVITSQDFAELIPCLVIVAAAVVFRTLLSAWIEIINKKLASDIKMQVRTTIFEKLICLGPKYINDKRSGKVQSLLLDGIESLEPFLINYVPQLIALFITGALIICYSLYLDLVTGCIMIVIWLLSFIIPNFTMPWVKRSMQEYWGNYAILNANYVESIQGITTLKAFNASKQRKRELTQYANDFYSSQLYNTLFSVLDSGIMIALSTAAANLTVGIAAFRAGHGIVEASAIAIFLFLSAEFSRPMMDLNGAWHNSFLGLSVMNDLFEILEEKDDRNDDTEPDKSSLDGIFPEIIFDHVTFTYPRGKKPALKDLTLTIPSGSTIAIVGQSGSGKSTMANVLCRFYDIDSGSIMIGGNDIRKYELEYLRKHIGVVFQDNYFFSGTIAENIAMAKIDADIEEIKKAAIASGADEFINELPDGYDTIIGERGTDLSGGQRQRLAIARALMKSSSIMIFDEATSNVDAANEAYIKEMIDQISKKHTTIIIAHRLSTIRNADCIVLLDNGTIAEMGTHEELMDQGGAYAHMVKLQMGGAMR